MSPQIDLTTHIDLPAAQLPQAEPCVLVIFGASGDLTRRKLMPALFHLACEGCMAGPFQVVGIGRQAMSDDAFRAHLREGVAHSAEIQQFSKAEWERFAPRITYLPGDFADADTHTRLAALLDTLPDAPNRLYYLATA
ncbi:MAG: glucose-6-phosphate dehydrogenase, partial [Betaproteobacteria bacterium HGW-Betaproteobacteria-17]